MPDFKVVSKYEPAGDQPAAMTALTEGVNSGVCGQILKGVTGSGKTYTIAKMIEIRADAKDIKSSTSLSLQKQYEKTTIAKTNRILAEKIYDPQVRVLF